MTQYDKYFRERGTVSMEINYDGEAANIIDITEIKDLYIAVCSGDYDTVKAYFDNRKTAQLNRRYKTHKSEISLVMAALNNKMYDICSYLLSVGETVTEDEFKELQPEISRAVAVTHIFQTMRS